MFFPLIRQAVSGSATEYFYISVRDREIRPVFDSVQRVPVKSISVLFVLEVQPLRCAEGTRRLSSLCRVITLCFGTRLRVGRGRVAPSVGTTPYCALTKC